MFRLNLLDDQPIRTNLDCLHFQRYLAAFEATVLNRKDNAPFVTGIFGPWGSGKSTLLGMLENRLDELNNENATNDQLKWVIIKFSPWLYSQEKSLLLPLLALLAQQESTFKSLIKKMMDPSLKWFRKRISTIVNLTEIGLPLKISLNNLEKDEGSQNKFFHEEIFDAIQKITKENKQLVFLIDDLDRCHDAAQIVNLLEQIKLFLHLDGCLFFIAADRKQVIDAINTIFPDSGQAYLEKFVQLAFDLPPHHSQDLIKILPTDDSTASLAYRSLCEVLGNNPRKLKLIWNEAALRMKILQEEVHNNPQSNPHSPDLNLLLRWLLIRNCGELAENPYRYLEFEKRKKSDDKTGQETLRKEFMQMLQLQDESGKWRSVEDQRLGVFLWNRLDRDGFRQPAVLTLYARVSGTDSFYSRNYLENACYSGADQAQFNDHDFSYTDLSGGYYPGAVFTRCNFTGADLRHSILNEARFFECKLANSCFDEAVLMNVTWENCSGLDELDTEPVLYEQIINDAETQHWELANQDKEISIAIMKAYTTILHKHKEIQSLTDTIKTRLTDKARLIHTKIYPQK